MAAARAKDPTRVGEETGVAKPAKSVEAQCKTVMAATLVKFPSWLIEREGDLTQEGVRKLKRGDSAPSMKTLVKLARSNTELGPAAWAALAELCGRGAVDPYESPRLNSLLGAVHTIAKSEGPVGAFARAVEREMNNRAEPRSEPAAIYDLFGGRRG